MQAGKPSISKPNRCGLATMIAAALALVIFAGAGNTRAAGLLIADGGFGGVLQIKTHDVKVTINNGIAVTEVTQVFQNMESRQVEALYTFPVPKQASVSNFSMWINGKEMVGEVLEKQRARQIYNSYKEQRRDPGLLEQVDYKRFEMRIFPIDAGAAQKVQLVYYQELEVDHDQVTYVYPLATVSQGAIDARTNGRFSFRLEARSAIAITGMESPSHHSEIVVADHSDTYKLASLEQKEGSLASDVVIHYALKRPQSGIDMVTARRPGENGYFYATITAGQELTALDMGMDYIFLLDISGSMAHDNKLPISRRSLSAFINELDAQDRFEVMTFNVQPITLFNQLKAAAVENQQAAGEFLESQAARGGTILAPALTTAYKYGEPDRPLNVVILSDGMTEQKERQALMRLITEKPAHARVFCIGIGNEINKPLLEQLAHDSGGLAAFVSRSDDFKRQAKAFRRKLMRPAASQLELKIEGIDAYDLTPARLPHLYHGAPVRVYGRYKGSGQAQVTLTGQIQGRGMRQSVTMSFPKNDANNPEIERMWAQKRIDELLKSVNRQDDRQAVLDEVIRLGEGYSIVTEYTSFLVLENDAEYQRWKIERRNRDRLARDRKAQAKRQQKLEALRQKAIENIGPQPVVAKNRTPAPGPSLAKTPQTSQTPQPNVNRRQSRDISFGSGFGSGPVGPLFIGLAVLMQRRRKRS